MIDVDVDDVVFYCCVCVFMVVGVKMCGEVCVCMCMVMWMFVDIGNFIGVKIVILLSVIVY